MAKLSGNIFAAVDIETSGLDHKHNEILEICVLILNNNFQPDLKRSIPFHIYMKPENLYNIDLEAIRVMKIQPDAIDTRVINTSREKIDRCLKMGADKYDAADHFVQWFERLRLPPFCRICPIGHNLQFDIPFIKEWLGIASYELCFSPHVRDTMTLALACNDICDEPPFENVKLSTLCNFFKIEQIAAHTSFDDCIVTAKCYSSLIRKMRF